MQSTSSITRVRTLRRALLICLLAPAAVASAQDNPYSAWTRVAYGYVKAILVRTAEKMPEENYAFRPTDAVRSFGEVVGHVADSEYMFCSLALGEKNPAPKIEPAKASKAELIAALKGALAYCDKAYDAMTDASGTQMVKFLGKDMPKLSALTANNMHALEHYGNLVTYMRLKNFVPPTSEPGFLPQAKN